MKKLLIFLMLWTAQNYAQDVQLVNVSYDPSGKCKKSFKVRIINRNSNVNRMVLNLQAVPSSSFRPQREQFIIPRGNVNSDGSSVYELFVDIDDEPWMNYSIEIKATKKRFGRDQVLWTKDLKVLKCNASGFQRGVVQFRGNTLERARENQCNVGQNSDLWRSFAIKANNRLESGKIYRLTFGNSPAYYEIIRSDQPATTTSTYENLNYASYSSISTPYGRDCNNGGDGSGLAYDLKISESDVYVYSNCVSCPSRLDLLNPGFAGGVFPINTHLMSLEGNTVQVQFTLKNVGNKPSVPTKVNFYLSSEYNSLVGVKANTKTINVPVVNVGGSFLANPVFTINDFGRQPGGYYLVVDVEPGNNDSQLQNNFVSIPMEVKSSLNSIAILPNITSSMPYEQSYKMEVYSLDGVLKYRNDSVKDKLEESVIIKNLPKGIYIIKKDKEIYKVSK